MDNQSQDSPSLEVKLKPGDLGFAFSKPEYNLVVMFGEAYKGRKRQLLLAIWVLNKLLHLFGFSIIIGFRDKG